MRAMGFPFEYVGRDASASPATGSHHAHEFEQRELVEAAFGRFPWSRIGLPPAAGAVTGLGILVLLVIVYDLVSVHRIHRSTMWAAPLIFAVNALAVPIGMTTMWHAFAAMVSRAVS